MRRVCPLSRRTVLAGLASFAATGARAQMPPQAPAIYELLRSSAATHDFRRRLVTVDDDRQYQLFTAVPKAPADKGGYPILYCLDGNAVFDRLTPMYLAQVPGLVVAGIGYPTELPLDTTARSRDYTPKPNASYDRTSDPRVRGRPIGGADAFLSLVIGRLRQEIEGGITVDATRRAIWGHSFGGLFSLYALFAAPGAFRRYIPVSPSTWFGDRVLFDLAARAPRREPASGQADVLVMLGDSEAHANKDGTLPPRQPAAATMELVEGLKARPDLIVQSHVFEGLKHGATFVASFERSLALAAS